MSLAGTTGLPKGVLSTQRQFLTNVFNVNYFILCTFLGSDVILQVLVGGLRASIRRGEDYPTFKEDDIQKGALVAVPLFHVTGTTSFSVHLTFPLPVHNI